MKHTKPSHLQKSLSSRGVERNWCGHRTAPLGIMVRLIALAWWLLGNREQSRSCRGIQDSPRSVPINALVTTNPSSWIVGSEVILPNFADQALRGMGSRRIEFLSHHTSS
jgi:hypothetical protein